MSILNKDNDFYEKLIFVIQDLIIREEVSTVQNNTRINHLLNIAKAAAQNSTCSKVGVGAVLALNDTHVLSTGYNGTKSGKFHCNDVTKYIEDEVISVMNSSPNIDHTKTSKINLHSKLHQCEVHAEENALNMYSNFESNELDAFLLKMTGGQDTFSLSMIVTDLPCKVCTNKIINFSNNKSFIDRVYFKKFYCKGDPENINEIIDMFNNAGIEPILIL